MTKLPIKSKRIRIKQKEKALFWKVTTHPAFLVSLALGLSLVAAHLSLINTVKSDQMPECGIQRVGLTDLISDCKSK